MIHSHAVAWVAVLAIGLIILLNSLVLFVLFSKLATKLRAGQPALANAVAKINSGTTALRQLLGHLESLPEKLAGVGDRSPGFVNPVREAIQKTDETTAATIKVVRLYLQKFDQTTDTVLSNFSTQTFRVHRAIIHPAIRLSGILQSASAVLGRFGGNRGKSPASYSPDEEIFI